MKATAKRAVLAMAIGAALNMGALARGANIVWSGGGADSNVSNTANWVGGIVPGGGDDAHFAGTVNLSPTVNGADAWLDLVFDSGAGPFVLGPLSLGSSTNLLTLGNTSPAGGNITNNSSNTQTINVDVKPRTGTVSATSGDLVFNGVFWAGNTPNRNQSGRFNTFAGNFNIYLNGPTTYGGGIVENGPGTLFLTNNGNENNGEITINNGAVQINVTNALGLIPGVAATTVYSTTGGIGGGSVTGDASAFTLISGGADTGVLKLSDTNPTTHVAAGSVTFAAEPLQLQARSSTAAHLENVSGNNTWQGAITFTTSAGAGDYSIQSDAGSTLNLSSAATITGVSGTQVLNLEGAGNGVVNSIISTPAGTLALTKSGAGTWTLNGANTYTGATTVTGGTLAVGTGGSIASSSAFSVANGGTLDVSAAGGLTLSAAQTLGGTGTLIGNVSDSAGSQILPGGAGTAGTLNFGNNLSLAGGDTIVLDLSNNATSGNDSLAVTGNLALNGNTTLDLNLVNTVLGSGTYHLINYGSQSGSGSFTLSGGGSSGSTRQTLTLSDTGGQVNLNVTGQAANLIWTGSSSSNWDLTTTKNFTNNGSPDFYYNLDSVTFDDSGNASSPINIVGTLAPSTMTVNSSKNYTFSGTGSLTGSMQLTKSGTGQLNILTLNDYTGGTVINGGTVKVGNGTTAGSLGTGPITNNGSLIFDWSGSTPISVPGNISGTGAITKTGTGEVDLGGASNYTGGTVISAGTLGASGATPLGTNAASTTVSSGARLLTLGTISIPGNINVSGSYDGGTDGAIQATGGTATIGATATLAGITLTGNTTLAADQYASMTIGSIAGTGSNLSLVGAGSFTFTGANTYDGTTTINPGIILYPNNANALGTVGSGTTIAVGGEVYATVAETIAEPFTISGLGVGGTAGAIRSGGATTVTLTGPITLAADSGFYVDGGATLALSGDITGNNTNLTLAGDTGSTGLITGNLSLGSGGVTVSSAGNWTIAGPTTSYSGPTTINTGATLTVGNGGTTGNLGTGAITDNGTLAYNLTSSYVEAQSISGTGGITQNGSGTTTLSGNNTFTGAITVNGGVLAVGSQAALGNPSGITFIGNGSLGQLALSGGVNVAAPITFDGRPLSTTNTVPAGIVSNGNNTVSGPITLQTGGNAYGFQSNSGLLTVSGSITNSTGSSTERYVYLSGAGNGLLNSTFAVGTATGGAGIGLVKSGTGTWTLSLADSANDLTGDMLVTQGTLAIAGYPGLGRGVPGRTDESTAIPTSIMVYSGATLDMTGQLDSNGATGDPALQGLQILGGTGTILAGGTLRAFSDNTISPGIVGAPGAMTINGNLLLSDFGNTGDPFGNFPLGTTLQFGLGATPSSANDSLTITGSLDSQDTANISITPLANSMAGTYTLITAGGGITGAAASDLVINNSTRYTMSLNTTSTQVQVNVSGGVGNLTWAGTANTWDVKTTAAWNGTPNGDQLFWTADNVTFDDTGAAQPTVTINTAVAPSHVTFAANSTNYTLSGTGKITGGTGIVKTGSGTLLISTANDYTGTTSVSNGVLQVGNAAALGAGSAPVVVSGTGTVDVNGQILPQAFTISGAGYQGQGALINTGGNGSNGGPNNYATRSVTLAGDASIGGTNRWDLRNSGIGNTDAFLITNGHTLTKVGSNSVWIDGAQVDNIENINITGGTLGLQNLVNINDPTNTQGGYLGDPNGTVTIGASGQFALWGDYATGQSYTKKWVLQGGTINNNNDPATLNGPLSITAPSTITVGGTATALTLSGPITGAGGITKTGTGPLTIGGTNNLSGALALTGGSLTVTGNTTVGQITGDGSTGLNISGGSLTASNQNHTTASLASLSIASGSTMDIGNGNLVVSEANGATAATIAGYIQSAYDAGKWDKAGLTSSAAKANAATTLAYLDTGSQVEVKYTWYGDLDLSGSVDASDFTAMELGNGTSWAQGDLNYDGVKNADDWALLALGYSQQNGSIPAGVPEPASAALLALALPALVCRRRRRA